MKVGEVWKYTGTHAPEHYVKILEIQKRESEDSLVHARLCEKDGISLENSSEYLDAMSRTYFLTQYTKVYT